MTMKIILYLLVTASLTHASKRNESKRDRIIRQETLQSLGGKTILSDKETVVNNCLMRHKFREIDYAFDNPQYFNFSRHFFHYKNKMHDSPVYQIIKDMPKGAALHIHDMGILGPDYLMNITYVDNLYICLDGDSTQFKFSNSSLKDGCKKPWQLVRDARKAANNVTEFDTGIRNLFTLVVDNPEVKYPSIKESWDRFIQYFITVVPLLTYRPIWEQYFYDALKLFRQHGIMYVEVRSILPNLYELDGTVFDPIITAKAYKKVIKRFLHDYLDFYGAKLIYAPTRKVDTARMDEYLKFAKAIKEEMPEYFAGFDIVGEEDLGDPLIKFVPQLEAAAKDLNYFFHAGETDWYGCSTDENLIDAILLGAKRLGHAYALPKHPLLMKEVLDKNIGLEVNVISNTVLSLVQDLRNHPLSVFLAHGLPVVLSSDDPGAWEADPISDDFYVTFVAVASKKSDLRLLKTLSMNSINYSALSGADKTVAMSNFNAQWDTFIDKFNCSMY